MRTLWKYLIKGWHTLEGIHTAIWAFGIVGITSSTLTQLWLTVTTGNRLLIVVLSQIAMWVLMALFVVVYVGYRTQRRDTSGQSQRISIGGTGGSGTIIGNGGTIIGGRGGNAGVGGMGGQGGSGHITGDGGLIVGGDGGHAGTPDGRGGRGARGPMELMGGPSSTWQYGRGGSGVNHPEYNRRLGVLTEIKREYMAIFSDEVPFIEAGVDQVPISWINKRLEERAENWRVDLKDSGYILPPL